MSAWLQLVLLVASLDLSRRMHVRALSERGAGRWGWRPVWRAPRSLSEAA